MAREWLLPRSEWARRVALGLVLLGAWLLLAPWVGAHAELRKADPAIGAIYRWNRPSAVRLGFTQKLIAEQSSIQVFNRRFEEVQQGATQLDPDDPFSLVVALPPLPQGTYTVNWQTMSVDGHPLAGSYSFTLFPRDPIITMGIAAVVLVGMGVLVFVRRARPGDEAT